MFMTITAWILLLMNRIKIYTKSLKTLFWKHNNSFENEVHIANLSTFECIHICKWNVTIFKTMSFMTDPKTKFFLMCTLYSSCVSNGYQLSSYSHINSVLKWKKWRFNRYMLLSVIQIYLIINNLCHDYLLCICI